MGGWMGGEKDGRMDRWKNDGWVGRRKEGRMDRRKNR